MENSDYFRIDDLKVKVFADGADLNAIAELAAKPWVKGFTTNPSLMKQSGVKTYEAFAEQVLDAVAHKPVSFEVFSDQPETIVKQAKIMGAWADNVVVKIPITNTRGVFLGSVIQELQKSGLKLNITAVFTVAQVEALVQTIQPNTAMIVSVFAGRIADTGRDPVVKMQEVQRLLKQKAPQVELLWASCREMDNIRQANDMGCDIITVTHDVLKKVPLLGKDLNRYSLETVDTFFKDAEAAGLALNTEAPPRSPLQKRRV